MKSKPFHILLLEDDDIDAMTVRRAIRELKSSIVLDRVTDGEAGLEYLKEKRPNLILLDLNMPRMNGVEFLDALKHDDELRRIPVVVLTTSEEDTDRIKTFNIGAAGYMVKPVEFEPFVEIMRTIEAYWTTSKLPE